MEASPRSSKRRKLDTLTRTSLAKKTTDDDESVYDDIDGALRLAPPSTTPSTTPKRKRASRSKYVLDPSQPHPFKRKPVADSTSTEGVATPTKPVEGGTANGQGASHVNGHKSAEKHDVEQDELAAESPSKRIQGRKPRASRTPTTTPRRRNGILRGRATGEPSDSDELVANVDSARTTPSKSGSRARAAPRTGTAAQIKARGDESIAAFPPAVLKFSRRSRTVPESEDEPVHRAPSSKPQSILSKRRFNRTDHTNNADDMVEAESEDEQATAGTDEAASVDGGSILDPTEPSPFNSVRVGKEKEAHDLLLGSITPGHEFDLLKSIVVERITGKRATPLVGVDSEYKTVHQLVEHTVSAGEGNSMLLIGARGSGKTALVNHVLSEVAKDNSQDFHVIRLNGFIHTDDKIALREIWRQLGKEMDMEEEGGLSKNYADTLTTLLALLSHPDELHGEATEQVAKAVVFVMDEFDLFAMHPRQTLLYNLFDIAQSRKAPIAVLGLTTRIDVTNSLEKRVKSRFSHRYVHLSLAKTFTVFQEMCKASLLVQQDQLSIEERAILCSAATPNKKAKKSTQPDVLSEWNAHVESLFASKTFLTNHLLSTFNLTKSIPSVLTSFLLPSTTLSPSALSLAPSNLFSAPDSHLSLLPTLSTLALSLLIATARLDIIHDSDTCNFNMAYDEYVSLASKARIQSAAGGASASGSVSKVWGKDVAKTEWELLVELGLLMPVVGGQAGGFSMIRCDVSLEEIGAVLAGEKGVDKGLERWCRHL
ncbi:hypothetical protein EJ04DRAFT_553680 [Polyplosphaeria fusca]|uniref:Origin recognition complex subunit 4 n=1 Tax=Polyplosphaeria fusca TaxID=682080 RepID=A0A9P4QSG9_9PLEO|nr:hypothetical protein EJ04DRAFT_553680 [Polyplosphaeria fusca]